MRIFFGQKGGSSNADVRTFGCKKIGFFKIYSVFARTRGEGVEPVRTLCGQGGRESIFRDFVQTSFMDGLLDLFRLKK